MSSLDHVDAMNLVEVPGPQAGNAWQHGARARRISVRAEDREQFDLLRDALVAEWRPGNVTAWLLVDHLARLQWRLCRAGEAEVDKLDGLQSAPHVAGYLAGSVASPAKTLAWDVGRADSSLQRIQLYQMRLERAIHRSIGLLIALRKSRGKRGGLPRTAANKKPPQPMAGADDAGAARSENGTNSTNDFSTGRAIVVAAEPVD